MRRALDYALGIAIGFILALAFSALSAPSTGDYRQLQKDLAARAGEVQSAAGRIAEQQQMIDERDETIKQLQADIRRLETSRPASQKKLPPSTPPAELSDDDIAKILATGNGFDYLNLTPRDRARLAVIIEQRIGQKEAGYYLEFLGTFYFKARDENQSLLWKPISETAAVAAAMP